jgi:hypothetical protein
LTDTFAGSAVYKVIGEPVSLPDAAALAAADPYQFQWWALGLVGARPEGSGIGWLLRFALGASTRSCSF